jgi:hypothetical protein
MSWRPKWQNFGTRNWEEIRDSWLGHIPKFPSTGARPDPGLERLEPLLAIDLPENHGRFADVPGLRRLTLWEAVFLFHKCAHVNLAAQRLGKQGMHSWCLFNAYHAAYLGARGTMAMLGIALPNVGGIQIAIDLYPQPTKKVRSIGTPRFDEFLIVRLFKLIEQRYLWEAFKRVLRMSDAQCWEASVRDELLNVSYEDFSRPRNHFLYRVPFWPFDDLITDAGPIELSDLFEPTLDVDDLGFLLRLSFSVYRLFEQLMADLGTQSAVIREQVAGSRFLSDSELPELNCYRNFLSRVRAQAAAG